MSIVRRRLRVDWTDTEETYQHVIRRHITRLLRLRVLLFLPEMPVNHRLCLCRRLRRRWDCVFPSTSRMIRQFSSLLTELSIEPGITVSDDLLLELLNRTGLDDVCRDLDLIGIHYRPARLSVSPNLQLIFTFSPDCVDHYLSTRMINRDTLCYGPNGDQDL